MSYQALLSEIQSLRRDLAELSARVLVLETSGQTASPRVTVNYLGSPLNSPGHPSSAPSSAAAGEPVPDQERAEAARSIGAFLRRSLAGEHRGESGRDRIKLQSRVYILCKDLAGNVYNPVRIYRTFSAIKPLVKEANNTCGDSIFIGLPSLWEARIAVDSRVVVAVPFAAWNRKKNKRALPAGALSKPVCCQLPFVERTEGAEGVEVGQYKFWLGLLGADFEDLVVFDTEVAGAIPDHPFTDQGLLVLPVAQQLADLCDQHFSFTTGAEQEPAPQPAVSVDARLSQLEQSFAEVRDLLKNLTASKQAPAPPKRATPAAACASPGLPLPEGLDPDVVASARAAGIPEPQIVEMARVAAKGKTRLPDLPAQAKPRKTNILSESEEDDLPVLDLEGADSGAQAGSSTMALAVAKLTQITSHLVAQKQQSKSLDALLDGVGSGVSSESSSLTGNRKHAAALRMLRHTLVKKPQDISSVLERNMATDFEMAMALPGSSHVPVSGRAWLELRSRVQMYQTPVRLLWSIAGIYDCIKAQRFEEAKTRALLALAAGDQVSIDRGSWVIAQEILLEDPPNSAAFQQHTLPGELEAPHSRMVDGRWMDLFIQKLHDWDSLAEKKRKLGNKQKPSQPPNSEPSKAAEPKKAGKAKGKGVGGLSIPLASLPSSSCTARPIDGTAVHGREASGIELATHPEARPPAAGTASLKVPGAAASPASVSKMWNSLLRRLMRSQCSLGLFARSTFSSRAQKAKKPSTKPVWPMPLPFKTIDEAADFDPAAQRALNCIVIVFNWLHLGQPARVPRDYCCEASLTQVQHEMVGRLQRLMGEWLQCPEITADMMGRTASKVEVLEDTLAELTKAAEKLIDQQGSRKGPPVPARHRRTAPADAESLLADVQVAKDIEAHRLKFSGCPSFDPVPYLDSESALLYDDPIQHSLEPCESLEDPPHVQVRGTRTEALKLLRKLDAGGRLALFRADQVRMTHRAGIFCLTKNQHLDRLILDSRPANQLDFPLSSWTQTMASVAPLLEVVVEPHQQILCSGEDLKDFYYFYKVSNSRAKRNSIKMELTEKEARTFGCWTEDLCGASAIIPALATMAMGDVNAVEFGQQSHMLLALSAGLKLSDCLTLRGRPPRDQNWMAGIVIDDFVVIEKTSIPAPLVCKGSEIADAMVNAYDTVGLSSNAAKRFRAESVAKFWGISLDGQTALVRAQLERVVPIACLTMQVAALGFGHRKLLEIIAGSWTAALQCRRRGMCLLSSIFDDIQQCDYGQTFQLASTTLDELWSLVALAPLFCSDLRADYSTDLSLVDASGSHEAEVSTRVTPPLARELGRHRLTKAAWTKMLSPFKAVQRMHGLLSAEDEVPEGEEPCRAHPFWTAVVKSFRFSLRCKKKIKKRVHINLSELNAALEAEARHARAQPSTRKLLGSDSQVVLGCLVKGRSSSKALNNRLRRALPDVLGFNVYTAAQYIATGDNTADDPTRDKECREPEVAPGWLNDAVKGDFSKLDGELKAAGLDDAAVGRLPSAPSAAAPLISPESHRRALRRLWHKKLLRTGRDKGGFKETPPVAASRSAKPWLRFPSLTDHAAKLLSKIPANQFVFPRGADPMKLLRLQGHLDLFSGSRNAARALAEQTGSWVLTYDIKHHRSEDLLNSHVQRTIMAMLESSCFASVTAGPVCSSFSRAVRPPVRNAEYPAGIPVMTANMREKVQQGNEFSIWLCGVIRRAQQLGLVWWVENPSTSFLWKQPEWLAVIADFGLRPFTTDYCRWRAPWRKRTWFLGNFCIAGEKLLCNCSKPHIQLRGYSKLHKMSWTKAAEAYPTGLSRLLGLAVAESLKPLSRQQKLDIAACARSMGRRIGEAANPGPRRRQHVPERPPLAEVELVRPATMILQQRVHAKFLDWLQSELSVDSWNNIVAHPFLQVNFLLTYGNWLYQEGEPMYLYRHLVVLLQQQFPSMRLRFNVCWDLLSRWELVEPVSHRPPLPIVLLNAFLSVALQWGWYRWAAVTALAFHGATRIGEPLRARRSDLVLPEEAGLDLTACFLNIAHPKAGRRGKGRVQHARISNELAVTLARFAFGALRGDQLLFPAAAATYRRRWDAILAAFSLPRDLNLTPGCLRGGGAVFLYHSETPLTDILWRMRLRHLSTLENYLQETAASNILQRLPAETRFSVKSCASMYPFLLRQLTSP
eukprot:Skav200720  [mRNA]  locus=scaffold2650:194332:201147:- [translate_table: standard]